jgi:hypothetical protein
MTSATRSGAKCHGASSWAAAGISAIMQQSTEGTSLQAKQGDGQQPTQYVAVLSMRQVTDWAPELRHGSFM